MSPQFLKHWRIHGVGKRLFPRRQLIDGARADNNNYITGPGERPNIVQKLLPELRWCPVKSTQLIQPFQALRSEEVWRGRHQHEEFRNKKRALDTLGNRTSQTVESGKKSSET